MQTTISALGPQQSLQFNFNYTVRIADAVESGTLISALAIEAQSPAFGTLRNQSDAVVEVRQD